MKNRLSNTPLDLTDKLFAFAHRLQIDFRPTSGFRDHAGIVEMTCTKQNTGKQQYPTHFEMTKARNKLLRVQSKRDPTILTWVYCSQLTKERQEKI